ncbi:MAG: hypothetical protein ACK4OE_21455 [Acidovorax sp.]|uniref:hypothetical protein n=1 Tax=Acidovorax sp. TaxID=1872122 RepID=UPI0039188266
MYSFENLVFFRGTSVKVDPSSCTIQRVRKDRKPRDTPLHLHNAADEWFLSNFGVRFRSQAILLSSSQQTATAYASSPANVHRIIPIDKYQFCWSPKVTDMLQLIDATTTPEKLRTALSASAYQTDDLKSAYESKNEVMLFCENYVAIPIKLIDVAPVMPIILIT